jgi:hypothetical protein
MHCFRKVTPCFLSLILILLLSSPAVPFELTLPDTGQELCYDWESLMDDCPLEGADFYGQDAHYTINPPNLTDNGDGTVTDNLTGLTWEQKTEENDTDSHTYNDAVSYCADLTLGGQDDWRVPTRKEHSTILNYGTTSPSLDTDYFPYYTSSSPNFAYYWTSSEYSDDSSQVWLIRLAFGLIDIAPKTPDPYRIRCVRGSTEPSASYTDNGDSTVTDNVAGLIWEQKTEDGSTNTYTWKDGLAYCEKLLLGGFSDWRLPNPKEFERLIDLGSSSPAIDTTYFPNTNNGLYWSGTTCSGCHKMKAFSVDFSDGELYYGNKFRDGEYYENYVRCVKTADDTPTTTTAATDTTTTTTASEPCTSEELYGEDSEETLLLRDFRDKVLIKTPEGREIIKLYYQWSPLIAKAMKEDKKFRDDIRKIMDDIIPLIDFQSR